MVYKIDYEKKIVNFGKLGDQLKENKISLEEFIIEDNNLVISFDIIKEIDEKIAIKDFTPKDKLKEDEDWKDKEKRLGIGIIERVKGENKGKIIVSETTGSLGIEDFNIAYEICEYLNWTKKPKSTEDRIYELIEQLKEESEEIGEDRVKENPAEYIEPPERDEDG